MTNLQDIKKMTAEQLIEKGIIGSCNTCVYRNTNCKIDKTKKCAEGNLKWLKSEAK